VRRFAPALLFVLAACLPAHNPGPRRGASAPMVELTRTTGKVYHRAEGYLEFEDRSGARWVLKGKPAAKLREFVSKGQSGVRVTLEGFPAVGRKHRLSGMNVFEVVDYRW
jgi:hypothetical protein